MLILTLLRAFGALRLESRPLPREALNRLARRRRE